MHLGGESDSPEKGERRAKSDDAKRGYAFRSKPAKMSALQNRTVKQPDADGANHLHPRQRLPDKEPAHQPDRVKRKSPPKQPRDRREEIAQRRQMIKNGMQLMRLELALLHEIHHARDASERERAVSDQRKGRVEFQPRIRRQPRRMEIVDLGQQSECLNDKNERRGERAHQRKAIGRSDQHVNQRNRPSEENENLEQVRDRTSAKRMTADRQKRRLKNKSETDREKIKSSGVKILRPQQDRRPHDRRQKTNRRKDEKLSIHRSQRL